MMTIEETNKTCVVEQVKHYYILYNPGDVGFS